MKEKFVLDASALLSILLDEPGQARVNQIVDRAQIHAVNLAEVIARLVRAGMPPEKAAEILAGLYLEVDERIRDRARRVLRHAAGDASRSRLIARRLRVSDRGGAVRSGCGDGGPPLEGTGRHGDPRRYHPG